MNINNQARAYIEALGLNAISTEEVISWADSIILLEISPDIALIELSFSKNMNEIISNLNILSKGADDGIFIHILFGHFYDALKKKVADYSSIDKWLYFWAAYETTDNKLELEMIRYWDDIDLADDGILDDPQQVRKEMLEFLYSNKL